MYILKEKKVGHGTKGKQELHARQAFSQSLVISQAHKKTVETRVKTKRIWNQPTG